ncbi:cold-shock protein [Achromobacter marplatensis]|uniref:cold shock domain-containing protein n=1 Tax=Achromobacter marplatensis TaxID=470868 RepID=UPI000B517D0B|nr:cold shock domain-containing protein [Achromobacter marplatensis]OWT57018.1 cold-shock protein [Achromobacter marplatensis]
MTESKYNDNEVGTIKCFFSLKGYGFITRDKGKDLFFFYKDIVDESQVYEGAKVTFQVDANEGGKGAKAVNIVRIG